MNNELSGKADINESSIVVPVGTTANRPILGAGDSAIRFNSDIGGLEEWTGTEWKNVSADISAVNIKGTDTEANILAMVGMVAEDLWIASDTLDGWVYDGAVWINIGPLRGPQGLQGEQGIQGPVGNGIESVTKTDTVGLMDTYTVTFTDTTTTTFNVINGLDGQKVDHISKTSGTGAGGTTDVYTVWGDVAETINLGTFIVYNGVDGAGDMDRAVYDTNGNGVVDNAELVNGLTVETAVPAGAVFTDTITPLSDTLTSTSTTEALTANQGKVLKDLVDTKLNSINPSITGSITEQVYNLTGTIINPANGTIQYKTVSANTTFTETLTAGQSVVLRLINGDAYTITYPTMAWVTATAPTLTSNCVLVLWKEQTTLYGAYIGSLV